MTVDSLVIAGPNLFRPALTVDELVRRALPHGIDTLVVAPGRPEDYALPPANDRLAAQAANSAHVVRLGRVDPLQGGRAVREAQRCLTELGCRGLFLHPGEETFPVTVARDVVEVAAAHGSPVVVATGVYSLSEPLQVLSLAAAVPEAVVVMTSGGQINISGLGTVDAWAALERSPRLCVMTNGEYRQDYLERLTRDLDPHRVLFASWSPYYDQGFELRRVRNVRMPEEARALVEGGNAARLFGIDGATEQHS